MTPNRPERRFEATSCMPGGTSSAATSPPRCWRRKRRSGSSWQSTPTRSTAGDKLDLTKTLVMRRMPSVSPYPHWHYFDAISHPATCARYIAATASRYLWGNMTMVSDPCRHWAVFRMLQSRSTRPSAQISVLRSGDDKRLYCCQSIRSKDAAENTHVLCAGVDPRTGAQRPGFRCPGKRST